MKVRLSSVVNTAIIILVAIAALMLLSSLATQRGQSLLGFRSYIVLTGSMSPEINAGSYIVVKEAPADEIAVGDIVSYIVSDGETVLTHRVVEKQVDGAGGAAFITQGDANNAPDERPVPASSVLGIVRLAVPGAGAFLLSLHDPKNLAMCIGILAVIFLAPDLYRKLVRGGQNAQGRQGKNPDGEAGEIDSSLIKTEV